MNLPFFAVKACVPGGSRIRPKKFEKCLPAGTGTKIYFSRGVGTQGSQISHGRLGRGTQDARNFWEKLGLRLRVTPPGIEWKTGQNPKMGKNWPKNRKGPSARGEKMAQKWRKNRKMTPNPIFSPFLGHFFPISGRGPFSIFWPIFSHFWILARFPFYTRRPDSQAFGLKAQTFEENQDLGSYVLAEPLPLLNSKVLQPLLLEGFRKPCQDNGMEQA